MENNKKALKYYEKSLQWNQKSGDEKETAISLSNLGLVYKSMNKYSKAMDFLKRSLDIAAEKDFMLTMMDNYKEFYEIYYTMGKYKDALDYYQKYVSVRDSIFNSEKHKQLLEMRTKFKVEKREKEVELLTKDQEIYKAEMNKRNWIIFSLILVIVIAVVFFFILFKFYKEKTQLEAQLEEKEGKSST